MKLRYRLFIWVGLLFVIAFAVSFYIEAHVTRVDLIKTRQSLLDQLYEVNKKKGQSIESYISELLSKIQAQIDSVLKGIADYQLIQQGFAPSSMNLRNGTWLHSASLMITNQWLGFVQNISDQNLMSETVVHSSKLTNTYHFPIEKSIHLVAIQDSKNPNIWKGPYIGIGFNLNTWYQPDQSIIKKEADENYFVFFTPQTLLSLDLTKKHRTNIGLSVNLLEPFLKWIHLPYKTFHIEKFTQLIKTAQNLIQNTPQIFPTNEEWKRLIEKRNQICLQEEGISPSSSFPKENHPKSIKYVNKYIEHYNKVGLVWGISALTNAELFGYRPIGPQAPIGMGMLDHQTLCGRGVQSTSVFQNKIEYNVEDSIKNLNLEPNSFKPHLDVIIPKDYHHIFLVNTLKLKDPFSKRFSYLTLGVHGGPLLSTLARATDQLSMFVSQNRVIAVSDAGGGEVPATSPWFEFPIDEYIDQSSGIIKFHNEEYFFLHIWPYKDIDLHFFIFNLKSKEFQFIDSINKGTKKLIDTLSTQLRIVVVAALIIVLFLLSHIAKRVTKSIAHLAQMTQTVAEGKLDEIEIPKEVEKKQKRKDEVDTLYQSFFEMVKGLREKEKVRGVLNKVVSKEIAEETLKGNIQLGGEEKQVTVFFADIRNFTSITEQMDPKDVIHLINECMTKISHKIDGYGGVIDKYMGDAVMALFGAPIENKESALHAIECAIKIVEAFKTWNQKRKRQIELGIGIHTGAVIAGNMGAEDRLNYTVLGANVNLASRLCSQAKPMQILISKETLNNEAVKNHIRVEELTPMKLKGFTFPIPIYAVKTQN